MIHTMHIDHDYLYSINFKQKVELTSQLIKSKTYRATTLMTFITELEQFRRVRLRKPMQRAIDNNKNLVVHKIF
jgi:hypothetical protein